MKQIADLHIHSRFSMATSKDGTMEMLDLWARKKGITLIGTGDMTHPLWRQELKEKLIPAEQGLFRLKEEYVLPEALQYPGNVPRFVLSGEISSIYKKDGKTRKVHSLILLPGFHEADAFAARLEKIGNIHSDGRPILGLPCHDLLEIMLEVSEEGMYIHALETGLSSDPVMNWQISALDGYQLVSHSDAHSPSKLGREADLLDMELSYEGLWNAVQKGEGLEGTIEFFPEEGKYHYDGHRKCGVCLSPREAEKYNGICPVCGKKLTMGVDHRILQLSDRDEGAAAMPESGRPYESLVPLPEVISACVGFSTASKKVQGQYEMLLGKLGAEFEILRKVPCEDIRTVGGASLAEGIRRLRAGEVIRKPGFDGEYGKIELF